MFLTGSDEHGMKVMRSAEKVGLTPKQFVDKTVDGFKAIWKTLGITYDKFIRSFILLSGLETKCWFAPWC